MKLVLNLATRGRPEMAADCIERTLANVRDPNTRLMVSVDEDDKETQRELKWIGDADFFSRQDVTFDIREREDTLGAKFNRALEVFPDADLYMTAVDDGPHITEGFDAKIIEAAQVYPDGYVVVANHLENLSFSSIQAVSRKIIDKMGFWWPPYWPYWFGDHWIDSIGRGIGRLAFVDIHTDRSNVPPTIGRRDIDFWAELFNRLWAVRDDQIERIIQAKDFMGPRWQKQALLRNRKFIHEHDVILNAIAVNSTINSETAEDDERSQRARAAAEKMVGPIPRLTPTTQARHPMGVIFATPVLDTYEPEFVRSWSATERICLGNRIPYNRHEGKGQQFIANARNVLVAMFLKEPAADNLFFLDADIGWDETAIPRFLQRPEPVVVGMYRRREMQLALPGDFKIVNQALVERDGLIQLNRAPTGFMRVKRWVIEKLIDEFDEYRDPITDAILKGPYKVPVQGGAEELDVPNIFRVGVAAHPDGQRYHGEDMIVSEYCTRAGIEIWLDPNVMLTHTGKFTWAINVAEILPQIREFAAKCAPDGYTMRIG
jgi:hypothetical protein